MASRSLAAALTICACALMGTANAQTDIVLSEQKISDTAGSFFGTITNLDEFGNACTPIGDHDGDGVEDVIIAAWSDDDGGLNRGAIWVVFLNSDGTVKGEQCISDTLGNFTGTLNNDDAFGTSVAYMGDMDGDGIGDVAVGAWKDDDGYG